MLAPQVAYKYYYNLRMPTFRIFSDLHLEFDRTDEIIGKCKTISTERPVDYLILAGDIVNYEKRNKLSTLTHELGPFYKNIFYVLGNHEYYTNNYFNRHRGAGQLVMERIISDYREICEDIGIILLENEGLHLDEFTLYGSTLWSKLSPRAIICLNDKYYVGPDEVIKRHQESKEKLTNFLERAENKPTIVITHHLPSYQFIDPRYYEEDPKNGMNAGFASNSEELFKTPITDWVFGHTHTPMQKHIDNINFWCNPHGYPGENEKYNDLVITL